MSPADGVDGMTEAWYDAKTPCKRWVPNSFPFSFVLPSLVTCVHETAHSQPQIIAFVSFVCVLQTQQLREPGS